MTAIKTIAEAIQIILLCFDQNNLFMGILYQQERVNAKNSTP